MSEVTEPKQPSIRKRVPIALAQARNTTVELVTFWNLSDDKEHIACLFGRPGEAPLVRLHSECLTGDVLGSLHCDCGPQLQESIEILSQAGGILLYLRQEGRGIGLYNKLDTYDLQSRLQLDTYEANRHIGRGDDERDYRVAAEMLQALGIREVRLITNNPNKVAQLALHGIIVRASQPTGTFINPHNRAYLQAKVRHSGHQLRLDPLQGQEEGRSGR